MTDPSPAQPQPQVPLDAQAAYPLDPVVYRRLSVKGSGGVAATVIVMTQRGYVWVSIMPPFTWEAIMEPVKVDELIHMLGLARDDAKKMAAARGRQPNKAIGARKAQP
ncbi:MAG: hypothetical protein ACRDRP_05135 [Pseudonocardiaceae bacterium]